MLVEGPHLLAAALAGGVKPFAVLATEAGLANAEIAALVAKLSPVVLSESAFRAVVDADSPPGVAAEMALPDPSHQGGHHVFLEAVQDPGNVGAIIRNAAAFGIKAVVVDRACADPWSPKVLRAGMGGHFALNIRVNDDLLAGFAGKLVCAVPREGVPIAQADLSGQLGWLFGSEGRGVSPSLKEKADLLVTIPTAPGTESLNVAAAAAICLHAAFRAPRKTPRSPAAPDPLVRGSNQ